MGSVFSSFIYHKGSDLPDSFVIYEPAQYSSLFVIFANAKNHVSAFWWNP